MIVGMDFGTTNSGMAHYDGKSVHILPLDPANRNPRVLRTAVYVTNDQTTYIGRTAVDRYFEHNIGRPVKMQRVWIGELEVYGADMYYVTDAFAWIDVLSPGRLFLSVKSSLRDEAYAGTVVGQFYYSLENLIALYLTVAKVRAEQQLGQPLRELVLGRPVRFATDPEKDKLAQARLLQAAFRAGYEKVYLQYEPIAAAFNYETGIEKEEHVLVFDFGGGTLDITVMRLGDPKRRAVLATGGIPVAGDLFDQKLVRTKLPRHFGEGSVYGPRHKPLAMPHWIYDSFADWQKILELQSAENKRVLEDIARTARRRYQIEALVSLVSSNYGLKMFDIVERAKVQLSTKRGAEILLQGEGFHVREFVTRTEFEGIIRAEIHAISQHLDEVLAQSELTAAQIDAVIRTGGSSEIPAFHEMLLQKFGADKVQRVDTFSSVTAGLGVLAHGIEAGELELPSYTPQDVYVDVPGESSRPNVSPINLELLQRRIALAEGEGEESVDSDVGCFIFLDDAGNVKAIPKSAADLDKAPSLPLQTVGIARKPVQVITAAYDETLLLITSEYRFLRATVRQLLELQSMSLALTDLHPFGALEYLCTIASWDAIKQAEKMLIVTSQGVARPYPMAVMQDNIETPVPLKFNTPLLGVPVAALAANAEDILLLVSRKGRSVRYPLSALAISGTQALNCGKTDRVMAAELAAEEAELLIVTADGFGRYLRPFWVPQPSRPNQKGKSLVARRTDVVGLVSLPPSGQIWALTGQEITRLETDNLSLFDSTKTEKLLRLQGDDQIGALLVGEP